MQTVPRVLIVGGTGRMGASTAVHLVRTCMDGAVEVRIDVGGRNADHGRDVLRRIRRRLDPGLESIAHAFVPIDVTWPPDQLAKCVEPYDLVLHTAGPFQRYRGPLAARLLDACVRAGVRYQDVCDDLEHATYAREALFDRAAAAGVVACVSTGAFPGLSNLMAAEGMEQLRERDARAETNSWVDFSYFTAGTGGAGPTILSATLLLLAQPALCVVQDTEQRRRAWSDPRLADFGEAIGHRRPVYLLNLPEVRTVHRTLGVRNVSARFGTAPPLWNWTMASMARVLPPSVLRQRADQIARLGSPLIRAVDRFVGARTGVRVDCMRQVEHAPRASVCSLLFCHDRLEGCVGETAAAMAYALLFPDAVPPRTAHRPGVWYPEELFATAEARWALFEMGVRSGFRFTIDYDERELPADATG